MMTTNGRCSLAAGDERRFTRLQDKMLLEKKEKQTKKKHENRTSEWVRESSLFCLLVEIFFFILGGEFGNKGKGL